MLLPETPADATQLATRVRPLDVDPMGHMNNAAYLDVVDEVVAQLPVVSEAGAPDDSPAGRLYRVGYLQPALPGAGLDVAAWRPDAGSIACRICDGDGGADTRAHQPAADHVGPGRRQPARRSGRTGAHEAVEGGHQRRAEGVRVVTTQLAQPAPP